MNSQCKSLSTLNVKLMRTKLEQDLTVLEKYGIQNINIRINDKEYTYYKRILNDKKSAEALLNLELCKLRGIKR